jgi:hypothetical protein
MKKRDPASGNPSKADAVGAGRIHWDIRDATFDFIFFFSAHIRMEMPTLPSGVSFFLRYPSIPASQGQPIFDVANPVASTAALYAHCRVAAVIITLESQTGNASA